VRSRAAVNGSMSRCRAFDLMAPARQGWPDGMTLVGRLEADDGFPTANRHRAGSSVWVESGHVDRRNIGYRPGAFQVIRLTKAGRGRISQDGPRRHEIWIADIFSEPRPEGRPAKLMRLLAKDQGLSAAGKSAQTNERCKLERGASTTRSNTTTGARVPEKTPR